MEARTTGPQGRAAMMESMKLFSASRSMPELQGSAEATSLEGPPCSWMANSRRPATPTMAFSQDWRPHQEMIYGNLEELVRPSSAGSVSSSSSAGSCTSPHRHRKQKILQQHAVRGDVIHNCKRLGLSAPIVGYQMRQLSAVESISSPTKPRPIETKPRLNPQELAEKKARNSPELAELTNLDGSAGIGTLDRDQPHLGNFLGYRRYHGMPFQYTGKRDPKFTSDGFNVTGEPALRDKVAYSKRYTGKAALTNLHEFRRIQRCSRQTVDESCRGVPASAPQFQYNTNDVSVND